MNHNGEEYIYICIIHRYVIYIYIFNIVNQLYFNKIEKIKYFLLKINIYTKSTGILRRRMSSAPKSPPVVPLELS